MSHSDELDTTLNTLDDAMAVAQTFMTAIEQPVLLQFDRKETARNEVTIYFRGSYPDCPIAGLDYDAEWQIAKCDIGLAFDSTYRLLLAHTTQLQSFPLSEERLDSVYELISDLRIMAAAVHAMDNSPALSSDFVERVSCFQLSKLLGPFWGVREPKENTLTILKKHIDCRTPDYTAFITDINRTFTYQYFCENLYQICGALLDHLCRYSMRTPYNSRPSKFSLRRCLRCGRYFITEDRKTTHCLYKDADGRTCAEKNEMDRKKRFSQRTKSDEEMLAEKIRRRLYEYRKLLETSRENRESTLEYRKRDELFNLYMQRKDEHSVKPDYMRWLTECESILPAKGSDLKTRNESYDKFYEWLLERS